MKTQPGDRWLICSDGLSSYVAEEKIQAVLTAIPTAQDAAERLIKESLDQGAPDNVTIVLLDIDETGDSAHEPPVTVGSAAVPLVFETDSVRRPLRLPSLLLHPLKATPADDSHFEPESDEYLDALILEDRRRARKRRISWLAFVLIVIAVIVAAGILGYQFTQRHYYVGVDNGRVAIFQGVQQDIGPIKLSHVYFTSTLSLDDLSQYQQQQVEGTINATDLANAKDILEQLSDARKP